MWARGMMVCREIFKLFSIKAQRSSTGTQQFRGKKTWQAHVMLEETKEGETRRRNAPVMPTPIPTPHPMPTATAGPRSKDLIPLLLLLLLKLLLKEPSKLEFFFWALGFSFLLPPPVAESHRLLIWGTSPPPFWSLCCCCWFFLAPVAWSHKWEICDSKPPSSLALLLLFFLVFFFSASFLSASCFLACWSPPPSKLEANILPMGGILSIPLKSRNFARTTNKRQKEKIEITKTHNQKIQSSSRVRENSPSNPQKKTGLSKILTRIHPCTLTPWGGEKNTHPPKKTKICRRRRRRWVVGESKQLANRSLLPTTTTRRKKQLHPRFRTVQILAKSLPKKSLT